MKIHLIKTPEYESENLNEVYQILNSYKGPMEFELNEFKFSKDEFYFLQYELYTYHNISLESNVKRRNIIFERGFPLSWEELFSLCEYFRMKKRIRNDDYVFLLTYRINSLNWFSHCNEDRNGFIHAADWDKLFIRSHHKYPVAYQIVENILQLLMGIDATHGFDECVHFQSRGCINDFCFDKRQIVIKLRTADICDTCLKRIFSKDIPLDFIEQVFQILEGLRTQLLFKKDIKRFTGPFSIKVDEDYKILIPQLGSKQIIPEPLFRALYILLLQNPDGIKLKNLSNYKKDLKKIYEKLSPNLTPNEISSRIDELTNPIGSSFSQKKSKINAKLKKELGENISQHFQITGKRTEPFKINLSPDNIDIRF